METKEKTQIPEQETALVTREQISDLFGTPEITQGMLPPQITILKDAAMFEYGGEQHKSLAGHILFVQKHNVYYPDEYDPNDPQPPTCSSADGIKPDDGDNIQAGLCAKCPHNSRRGKGGEERGCSNRIFVYFLIDGHAYPSIMDLPPTNHSNKAGPNKIMSFEATAKNMANAAGIGPYSAPVKVELTLNKVIFSAGPSSTLNVECVEVVKDINFLATLVPLIVHIKSEYRAIIGAMNEPKPETANEEQSDDEDVPI